MKVATGQIREVVNALADHLEASGVTEVEITWDYYWDIPTGELYDPYRAPKALDLGQLSDDWQKLQDIASGKMPPVGYAFTWLAAVLRAVGEKAAV